MPRGVEPISFPSPTRGEAKHSPIPVRARESGHPGRHDEALACGSGSPLARGRTEKRIQGKLHRSRRARTRPRFRKNPPPETGEGDGAPNGASSPSVRTFLRRCGAFRRAVAAISVPGAVLPGGMTGAPFGSPHPDGFRPPFVFRHRPALSGRPSSWGRTAGRGLPGARLARPRPRAPARTPRTAQPVRVPSGDRAKWNIVLVKSGIKSYYKKVGRARIDGGHPRS